MGSTETGKGTGHVLDKPPVKIGDPEKCLVLSKKDSPMCGPNMVFNQKRLQNFHLRWRLQRPFLSDLGKRPISKGFL